MYYAPHASTPRPKWGVVCTCLEPRSLVLSFVAHHIAMGASEVHLFLDAPQPDLEATLDQIPQVIYHVCDARYWHEVRGRSRPKAVEFRQLVNAYRAYRTTSVDWLAHFDADEFLHVDLPIADILGALPEEVGYALVEPRERAFVEDVAQETLFEGVFRRPLPENWGEAAYLFGGASRFLRRGLLAHHNGKSFMRTGIGLVPGIHTPRRPKEEQHLKLEGWPLERARLLHFDGLTSLHWSGKLLRAAHAGQDVRFRSGKGLLQHRARQITRMRRSGANLQNAMKMHDRLKSIPQVQLQRLAALGLIEDYRIDPKADFAALGLDHELDLSRAAFDAALGAQTPQINAWISPWEDMLNQRKASQARRNF